MNYSGNTEITYTGWSEPQPVDEYTSMKVCIYRGNALLREGRVDWANGDNFNHYSVAITVQEYYGLGLYCWPKFRVLSEAQDFVERLINMTVVQLQSIHGRNWPNVVL